MTLAMQNAHSVLTHALIEQARIVSAQQDVSVLMSLQQVSGWSPEALMAAIGEGFGYVVLAMRELQALRPDFDAIGYSECVQRGVLIASNDEGSIYLVLSDPFDGSAEDWALRRCARLGLQPLIALAHPDDLQAYFVQQEHLLRAMDDYEVGLAGRNDEEQRARPQPQ